MTQSQDRQASIEKIRSLIKGINIAMMSTSDADGTIHSRPMGTQQVEFDGDLWFFTEGSSEKVNDIKQRPQVNLSYGSADHNRYVSVSGAASISKDKAKMEELWSPMLKAWFPDGLDDPDLTLIKVSVEHAEYWESSSSKVVNLVGFIKAVVTGKEMEGGENEKITLSNSAQKSPAVPKTASTTDTKTKPSTKTTAKAASKSAAKTTPTDAKSSGKASTKAKASTKSDTKTK